MRSRAFSVLGMGHMLANQIHVRVTANYLKFLHFLFGRTKSLVTCCKKFDSPFLYMIDLNVFTFNAIAIKWLAMAP